MSRNYGEQTCGGPMRGPRRPMGSSPFLWIGRTFRSGFIGRAPKTKGTIIVSM